MLDRIVAVIVALVLGVLAAPLATATQEHKPGRTARIGRLSPGSAETDALLVSAFRKGLHDLGWVEGQSFTIESRFAEAKPDRLAEVAAELVRQRVDVILVGSRIVALAAKSRLPAVYGEERFVDASGLMFYGAGLASMYRQAAVYVDKILKGVKPADLPVEQPTKFELILNLKVAKAIGITIPPAVLARADRVVE